MTGLLERLGRKTREVGPVGLARLILRRLVPAHYFFVARFVLFDLQTDPDSVAPSLVRWAEPDELELLSSFGHGHDTLRDRFDRGDCVCVLIRDHQLASYAWFRAGQFEEPDLGTRFRIGQDEIWLYDAMVAPRLRGQGTYPIFLRGAAALHAKRGLCRILVQVNSANRNSLRAHRAAGCLPIAQFSVLRLFGYSRVQDPRRGGACWLRPGECYETDTRRS
jgi:hypothetical protein